MSRRSTGHPRRGSVLLVVIWALSVAALVVSSVQLFGYRQAMLGREALARVQARWAARGGVERTIAVLADHTENPVAEDAFAMVRDMEYVAADLLEVAGQPLASYDIRYHADRKEWQGPMDEHSKLNINAAVETPNVLLGFEDMTPDIVDAIRDWIDENDDVQPQGAERDYYLSLSVPYEPRNAPMRSVAELELVAGIWPEHLRGEDWNLNNRIDANEDDGDRTWPMDDPDQELDGAWSALLTTYTSRGAPTASGLERISLGTADPEELQERLGVDEQQASALIAFGRNSGNRLEQLLTSHIEQQKAGEDLRNQRQSSTATSMPELEPEQLRAVFAETTMGDPDERGPGKLNINTISEQLLLQLLFTKEHLADEIVYLRNSRPEGITSMVDLVDIPAFQEDTATLEYLARLMDTTSNVYSICSKGRSWAGGVEVEIIAVVDRSTLPVRILEYREQ
ncbi:MAG: hypothetical protein ACYS0G_08660 [Planctomycetota bacterium]|jgi:DNA uptake protein ComE-like DNA-binding protein